ncbi:UDP-glucose 4-epimerase family protein [Pseudomonas linyingensis]|nr:SDR family oxidoreductase [Pseudomonas linyingensis]
MRTLLTGASGFLGGAVQARLLADNAGELRAVFRRLPASLPKGVAGFAVPDLAIDRDWRELLDDVNVVVHCAARVHVMDEKSADPLAEFRKVNVDGTLNLARQAAAAGVKRFIFISSIKVNGEGTGRGKPYKADDVPAPVDPYGISKLEAEQGLLALAAESGMEVVILRPVLVYGPGVKANFRSVMSWLSKGIPLPLGSIRNKRSLVALDNLVDLIVTCIDHTAAANQVFLVSDGEDLSTTELLRRMGAALGKPARLLPVPEAWLDGAACLLGKGAIAQRLCGSLQVDIEKTRRLLGWTPPVTVDDALRKTARHFQEHR